MLSTVSRPLAADVVSLEHPVFPAIPVATTFSSLGAFLIIGKQVDLVGALSLNLVSDSTEEYLLEFTVDTSLQVEISFSGFCSENNFEQFLGSEPGVIRMGLESEEELIVVLKIDRFPNLNIDPVFCT